MHNCSKCNKEFKFKSSVSNHEKSCNGTGLGNKRKKKPPFICPKCGFEIKSSREKHVNYCDGSGPRRKRPLKGYHSWNKGKKYKDVFSIEKNLEISTKISNKLKLAFKSGKITGRCADPEKEKERKRKISETMILKRLGGYRKGSGRGKQGWYKGYWCDSSWELAYVIYNLEHNIKIERNKERFNYIFNNRKYTYSPDFIVNNEYIEIKGYITEQVKAKTNQFPNKLIVIDKYGIKPYLEYVINKYGKNFIDLYDDNI